MTFSSVTLGTIRGSFPRRAVFVLGPETLQVVLSLHASSLPWDSHDTQEDSNICEWFEVEQGPRIAREINGDITTPLFRLNLYRSPHSSYLAVSIHHAIYDGVAFPLLMKEVDAAYRAYNLQDAVPLAQITHHANLASRNNHAKEFWVSELEGVQLHDRLLHRRDEHNVVRCAKLLDISLHHLRSRCSRIHVTLEALFAGAIAYLGRRFLGWSSDAIFGVSSGVIGMFPILTRGLSRLFTPGESVMLSTWIVLSRRLSPSFPCGSNYNRGRSLDTSSLVSHLSLD